MHAPTPAFGMDIFDPDFSHVGVVLLSNNGVGNRGVPIRCDHFIMVFCISGEGHRRINHHRFQMTPGTAHLIQPGQIHSFSNNTSDFEIKILLFEKVIFNFLKTPPLVLNDLLTIDDACSPNMALDSIELERWQYIFEELNREVKHAGVFQTETVASLILRLFLDCKRKLHHLIANEPRPPRPVALLTEFRQLVEQHFNEKKSVQAYADLLFITPKHLSETVKSLTGKPALHFIHERILHEAEYLLTYTSSTVDQIARSLQFDTASHFGRFFKTYRNVTPLKYRRQQQHE